MTKFELEPYHRNISEEELIADLKRVAVKLNKDFVTHKEYIKNGKFSLKPFINRFGSWANALEKAGLKSLPRGGQGNFRLKDEELISDLKRVALELKNDSVTANKYNQYGKFTQTPFQDRFGSWNKGLEKAGLRIANPRRISKDELFENLENVWIKLGRQPHGSDMQKPLSKYSGAVYEHRFGTWRKALEKFIEYINKEDVSTDITTPSMIDKAELPKEEITSVPTKISVIKKDERFPRPINGHKTSRNISERLKVQVLMRDGNKCRLCGITITGENIHFDHIKAWSKGGETVLENLQVLCAKHNLAKGNL